MFKIPKYQLYLLQLESYELGRYFKLLFKKGFLPPDEPLRKKLIWTNKALLIFAVAEILIFGLAGVLGWLLRGSVLENTTASAIAFVGLVVILNLFSFLFFCLAEILIMPVDYVFKAWIVSRAKAKARMHPQIKIIGIAGSYGKTTMKEVLRQILDTRYKALATPESVNTPVGISRWIFRKFSPDLEIAIIEMGEHYKGDIREICDITKADVAVITGINEAHMERMGSAENVTATIFEAAQHAKDDALIILNKDDERILANYKSFVKPDQKVLLYSADAPNFEFSQQILGWQGSLPEVGEIKIRLMGRYSVGVAQAAGLVGKYLGLTNQQVAHGLNSVKPVEHRLQPSFAPGNILVIDDAYNGNSDGAREAIKVLAYFKERRKIYITPGLVETGSALKQVHLDIGRQLASAADVVILIRNSVTGYIEEGILSVIASPPEADDEAILTSDRLPRPSDALGARNDKPEIIWFDTAPEAHAALKDILKPNDVILFQNDWGDQYL